MDTQKIDKSLTESEAAEFLGISPATLKTSRCLGNRPNRIPCPPFYKFGPRCVRYSLADLEAYRAKFRVEG